MRILSCNVRRDNVAVDGENQWARRKGLCCEVIRSADADLICTQELSRAQFLDLRAALTEYDWFGMVDTVVDRDPMNAVFYRRKAFDLVSAGGYWLSETPHLPGSKSWDSDCIRLANWARLVDVGSGVEFRVVNTHLDHVSQLARENQVRLINEDAAAYSPEYPQVLTGDLNAGADNPAIAACRRAGWTDTWEAVHGPQGPGTTFHRFLGPAFAAQGAKIDWIFIRGNAAAQAAHIRRDSHDGRFPSDHYFLSADVILPEGPSDRPETLP